MRVVEDLGDVVHRPDRCLVRLEHGEHLVLVALGDPGADDLVELLAVLQTSCVVAEAVVVHELRPADRPGDALEDRGSAGGSAT